MFFDLLHTALSGAMSILTYPLLFSPFTISLWQALLGSTIIIAVGRMIWGILE